MFSDESRFSLQGSDRRQPVNRRLGERYSDACVREVDKFGGGVRNGLGWDFSCGESAPSGYSG